MLDMVAYRKLKVPKQFMVGAMEVKKDYMPFFEPLYAKIVENKWAGVEAAQKLKVGIFFFATPHSPTDIFSRHAPPTVHGWSYGTLNHFMPKLLRTNWPEWKPHRDSRYTFNIAFFQIEKITAPIRALVSW